MPRNKSPVEVAAGKLILAIQKEWGEVTGTDEANDAYEVMDRAHDLQMAAHRGSLDTLLSGKSVVSYLGVSWLANHPSVRPSLEAFLQAVREHKHV